MNELVTNSTALQEMMRHIFDCGAVALDVETRANLEQLKEATARERKALNTDPRTARLLCVSLATHDKEYVVPLPPLFGNEEWRRQVFTYIHHIFAHDIIVVGHNVKFDLRMLHYGDPFNSFPLEFPSCWDNLPAGPIDDTITLALALEENLASDEGYATREMGLKRLVGLFLDREAPPFTEHEWWSNDITEAKVEYAAADARNCFDLAAFLWDELACVQRLDYYLTMMRPLIRISLMMELLGVQVDVENVVRCEQIYTEKVAEAVELLGDILGEPGVNINSTAQLARFIAKKWPLVKIHKTTTERPTLDKNVLRSYLDFEATMWPEFGEFVELLLTYRKYTKLISTYTSNVQALLWPDNRLRVRWNPHFTRSGRWSSSNINMQNQPKTAEIRNWYIAAPQHKLVCADLQQADIRMAAALYQDEALIALLNAGGDPYMEVGKLLLGREPEVDPTGGHDERYQVKSVLLGYIYGRGASSIAAQYGIDEEEAKTFIDKINQLYPRLRRGIENVQMKVIHTHQVEYPFGGRRRPIFLREPPKEPGWKQKLYNACFAAAAKKKAPEVGEEAQNKSKFFQAYAIRQALNAPVQGGVGELINLAIIDLFDQHGVVPTIQCHDELVYEVEEEWAEKFAQILKSTIERRYNGVEFTAEVKIVPAWGNNPDTEHTSWTQTGEREQPPRTERIEEV